MANMRRFYPEASRRTLLCCFERGRRYRGCVPPRRCVRRTGEEIAEGSRISKCPKGKSEVRNLHFIPAARPVSNRRRPDRPAGLVRHLRRARIGTIFLPTRSALVNTEPSQAALHARYPARCRHLPIGRFPARSSIRLTHSPNPFATRASVPPLQQPEGGSDVRGHRQARPYVCSLGRSGRFLLRITGRRSVTTFARCASERRAACCRTRTCRSPTSVSRQDLDNISWRARTLPRGNTDVPGRPLPGFCGSSHLQAEERAGSAPQCSDDRRILKFQK